MAFIILLLMVLDNNDDYLLNDTLRADIENTRINETLGVYPNPFTDKFTVTFNSEIADNLKISISNISGVKII